MVYTTAALKPIPMYAELPVAQVKAEQPTHRFEGAVGPDLTDDFVAKVKLLEESVGQKASYRLLDPFPLDANDAIQVQAAARRIAEFIGLGHYSFIVSLCRQKENVGGQIELRPSGDDVFIDVAENLRPSPSAVLATLAHELTHKYLQVNGVSSGVGPTQSYEDEILTDIASLWLGLGKLVLNGCESESRLVNQTLSGTQTTTTRHRVGYLTREQFAFVYLLISNMRGLLETEYKRALTAEALDELHYARQSHGSNLDPDWRTADSPTRIGSRLRHAVDRSQTACATVSRDITLLRKLCVEAANVFLVESHSHFKSRLEEFEKLSAIDDVNPSLRFLRNVELDRTTMRWESELEAIASRADKYRISLDRMLAVTREAEQPFPAFTTDMLGTVRCPQDGTILRVPTVKEQVRVRCDVCRYDWVVQTALARPIDAVSTEPAGLRSWLRRRLRRGSPATSDSRATL